MKKSFLFVITILLTIVVFLPACAGSAPPTSEIMLKIAHDTPPVAAPGKYFSWISEELENRTGGRVKTEIYPGGSLIKIQDVIIALEGRTGDMSWMPPGLF